MSKYGKEKLRLAGPEMHVCACLKYSPVTQPEKQFFIERIFVKMRWGNPETCIIVRQEKKHKSCMIAFQDLKHKFMHVSVLPQSYFEKKSFGF